MKIAMFTNTYKPHVGGVAKSVDALAGTLREMGHSVMVVAPTFPDTEVDFNPESGVVRVPALQNFNGSDFSVRLPAPFALTSVLDEFQPELIHSHHPFLLGDTAIRMARRYSVPLVFTHHTRYEHYTHYVSLESKAMRTFASQLAVEYANLCDGVIVPSESMQELLLDRGIKVPISVVPTGVDVQSFAQNDATAWRKRLQLPDKVQLIGHLGRLAEEKNLEYLGHSVALVLENYPEAHFAIAGDGAYREQLRNYFDSKNLAERVSFCGVLQGQELVDFYAGLDLFLFASVSETQGMVLAE
ncbi:MAG: glycosyltransferase, partial [Gammaproteobacteria bacterium]